MVTMEQIYNRYGDADISLCHWPCKFEAATIEMNGEYSVYVDFLKCKSLPALMWKLCHEYGHCATGATHKLASSHQLKMQHEFKANKKAALTFLPPQDFRAAFDAGVHETWELAEWFDIPEEQIVKVWAYYTRNGLL